MSVLRKTPEESDDSHTPTKLGLILHFMVGFCTVSAPFSHPEEGMFAIVRHGNRAQEPGWDTFLHILDIPGEEHCGTLISPLMSERSSP